MSISIWRFSHLALAVSSCLFILSAALSGIILAFEPVSTRLKPYATEDLASLRLSEALPVLRKAYPGITDLQIGSGQVVIVKSIDEDGKNQELYVNPATGENLGPAGEKSAFFTWVTTFHRSLFLHGPGRLLVGINAFLLFLITCSGILLVIQRQNGLRRFFSKLVRENSPQYYHVFLGRLSLLPILVISLTGACLSLLRLDMFQAPPLSHQITETPAAIPASPKRLQEFPGFRDIPMTEVQSLAFPFSDDPEEYYTLKLNDGERVVDQFTGEILSELRYPGSTRLSNLSLNLHTGRSSLVWAMVLAAACVNILYFIYSGFSITLRRRAGRIRNRYPAAECDCVILVGSENGSTMRFARALQLQLARSGQKPYLAELNQYTLFPRASQLIVLSSTYGQGQAPANASRFLSRINAFPQPGRIHFSVLGFGSKAYPDFCRFAFEVHQAIASQAWAMPLIDVQTVNDKSPSEFMHWAGLWSQASGIPVSSLPGLLKPDPGRKQPFTVTEKRIAGEGGRQSFLLRLKPERRLKFTSGDLLAVYPANDHRERFYSIARIGQDIQLSVRLHPDGLGSGYLYALEKGLRLEALVVNNPGFHFPKRAPRVIMISNGTGIAPFLGMISQNQGKTDCHLYCGFRDKAAFELYKVPLHQHLEEQWLRQLHVAYSREENRLYVKDLLAEDAHFIRETLENKGVIMICGSLAMEQDVMALLDTICRNSNGKGLAFFRNRGQLLSDCY